jgi:hypothetical protein
MNTKAPLALVAALLATQAFAADAAKPQSTEMHRYMIERTFPAHALDGLDAAAKAKVNENNSKHRVKWVMSYANGDKTRTWCVYEGPSEAAVRAAAKDNGIPVDSVAEVPETLLPK